MAAERTKGKNPYNICTWDEGADCANCINHNVLHCKWDRKALTRFLILAIIFMIMAFFGLTVTAILTGAWWPLIAYGVFYVVFFLFFEIRILCCHCPFYGEGGKILHCIGNHGAPKIWHYRPQPMNRFERVSLIIGFIFFGGFPIAVEGYGIGLITYNYGEYGQLALLGMIGVVLATLLTLIAFGSILILFVCPSCINFSCPLNRTPRENMDEYLNRNPFLKKAWEEIGPRGA